MAKTKKPKKLTKADYQAIAKKLLGTHGNVYFLARSMFDLLEWSDDHFDALEKAAGVFKCENCDEWKDVAEKDPDVAGYCSSCVSAMNGEEDE